MEQHQKTLRRLPRKTQSRPSPRRKRPKRQRRKNLPQPNRNPTRPHRTRRRRRPTHRKRNRLPPSKPTANSDSYSKKSDLQATRSRKSPSTSTLGVVEITPVDARAHGILANSAMLLTKGGLSIRQAIVDDPELSPEPKLTLDCGEKNSWRINCRTSQN